MNYLKIEHEDVCNGPGLRCTIWITGCTHQCPECFNKESWNPNNGVLFDESAKQEIYAELSKPYISGITFSGGDPLHRNNLTTVLNLINEIRQKFPTKTIWLYTGYDYQTIFRGEPSCLSQDGLDNYKRRQIISMCDVVVDGEYIDELKDSRLKFKGSSNQRVIDVKKSLKEGRIILYCD